MPIETAVMMDPPRTVDADASSRPPSLHWAVVLTLWLLTGGIFGLVWMFRQAAWVRRIDPTCKALVVLAVAFPSHSVLVLAAALVDGSGLLVLVASLVWPTAFFWSYFKMREAMEAQFDLSLSSAMTFFFHALYPQYHMRMIAKGTHEPRRQGLLR